MKFRQRVPLNPSIEQSKIPYAPLHIKGGSSQEAFRSLQMTTFDNSVLWESILVTAASNAIGCIVSLVTGSHLHLDLIGTGAFAIAAIPSTLGKTAGLWRVKLSAGAVIAWGTKLAGFLFYRALKVKHDKRLDETLVTTSGTISFWFVSLVWGVLCSLPHSIGSTSSSPGLTSTNTIGMSLFSLGFIIETVADYQKWIFKNDPTNQGAFCDVGLWSVSQHPNYFGNLMLWSGILVMNGPALFETNGQNQNFFQSIWSAKRLLISFLSPLFMYALFYGQASGAMLSTVEMAMEKYGNNPKYLEYVENVPLIFPKIFGWLRRE